MAAAVFLLLGAVLRLLEVLVLWEGVWEHSHRRGTGAELGSASSYLGIKAFMRSEKYFISFLELFSESFYYVFTPSHLGKREDIIEEADFMCQASMERSPSEGPEAPFSWHCCVWSYQISAGFNLKYKNHNVHAENQRSQTTAHGRLK